MEEEFVSHVGSKDIMKGQPQKPPTGKGRPSSMVVKKARTLIPAHIVAEAMSTLRGLNLRWSGPATPTEMQYVEEYVLAKYPQYLSLGVGGRIDFSALCINEHNLGAASANMSKLARDSSKEVSTLFFGSKIPGLDTTQLEPSRLLDILTEKTSFPGSFISIPEIQAQNKVLKHCGLTDDDYLVLFAPNYKEAMMLVGESYPFFRGNFYMTVIAEQIDYIQEFASYQESKVILAPETWLDLRIRGSQLSLYLRRKCNHSPKGLFSFPVKVNDTRYSLHWISEAHRYSWHVLLDATSTFVGKEELNLGLHKPEFVLCNIENTYAQFQPSNITCLLVRKKSFNNAATPIEHP